MARASRSKRSQPEFDPSELEDLILTPAVGNGVGSHLVGPAGPPLSESAPADPNMTTVAALEVDTVATNNQATVDMSSGMEDASPAATDHQTTVAVFNLSTVATPTQPIAADKTTADTSHAPTVVMSDVPPATEPAFHPSRSPIANLALWLTETGELVPASRVKRIRLAQDVINSAEESVYDTLWTGRAGNRVPNDCDSSRLAQAGYDFLMRRTRLSKKTIQRIIDRLIEKGFIEIHEPADIYHRTSTVYRVYSYRSVLDRQAAQGRTHVAKIGPGFVYVHPFGGKSYEGEVAPELATVDRLAPSTVGTSPLSTGAIPATPTVDHDDPTTVVTATTRIERQLPKGNSTSSEIAALRETLARDIGPVDDSAVRQLLSACRSRAGDCTPEEIAYFVRLKLKWVRNLQNPVGFILTAVPRHFENGGHLSVRELLRQESEEKARQWRETYRYWNAIADDPALPAADRAEARSVIASLNPPPDASPEPR